MKKNFLCRWLFLLAFVPALVFAGSSVTTPNPKLYSDALRADIASTATGKGSALVGNMPQGASAVPATVQGKLGEVVSVKDKGAVGDGVADDTAAISAALAASKSVYFPTGIYLINSSISLQSGSRLHGDGIDKTILRYTANANGAMLNADSGSSSAYMIGVEVRDMTLDGMSDTLGFSEHVHLLGFNGVKNAVVEGVKFRAPRGDGLYVGSGISGGTERHNVSVVVRNNLFNGINKTNRNGISVIDCNGLTIENNEFRNLTSAGMPGPIDVEPNNSHNVVKSIRISGNKFYANGGGTLIAVVTTSSALTKPLFGLEIVGNYFDVSNTPASGNIAVITLEDTTSVAPMGITIKGNVHHTAAVIPWNLNRLRGVTISGESIDGASTSIIGRFTSSTETMRDINIIGNTITNSSNSVGVISIASVTGLKIIGNRIQPAASGHHAITFFGSGVTTSSREVTIAENIFDKGAAQTDMVYVSSHKLTPASNIWHGNIEATGTLTSAFTNNTGK